MEKPWSLRQQLAEGLQPRISVKSGKRSLDRIVAIAVSEMLRDDPRSRDEIADDLSLYCGEQISKFMLDAYASKAREAHSIPAHRLLALTSLTGRWDVLHAVLQEFSTSLLTETDLEIFELGILTKAKLDIEKEIARRFKTNAS